MRLPAVPPSRPIPGRFRRLPLLGLAAGLILNAARAQTLLWSDEFNQSAGATPDPTKWTYDLGGGGWGNNELETYTSDAANCSVVNDPDATDGKALAITAIASAGSYTSARIKTQGLFNATYGLIEARVKLPVGQGMWPAFWMLGGDIGTVGWPACGEIDIMENLGSDPALIYGTLHGPGYSGAQGIQSKYTLGQPSGYHRYAVAWSPNQIQWMVDGVVYQTLTPASLPPGTSWVFNNAPFFLVLNLAVGGGFPGNPNASTVFPQTYSIDYVRVYAIAPAAPHIGAFAAPNGSVAVSWVAPQPVPGLPPAATYRLVRATDAAFTQNVTALYSGAATSYSDTAVAAGSTYYYEVFALAADGTASQPAAAVPIKALAATAGGTASFLNLSTRCLVGAGGAVAVAGLVVGGNGTETVLVRGVGPQLAHFGISGALPDPELQVFDASGNLIAANAGWSNNANASSIAAAIQATYAFPLPSGSADSALLLSLPSGQYTAQLSGASGDTGIGLIEAYEVP